MAGRSALLVVDNCEHVIDPCAELIDDLLGACPGVSVLATSREPIGVRGEVAWRVPSLGVPERGALTADALSAYDAVRLFIDRAVRVRPNFEVTDSNAQAIAEVCVRLDGIPLAIELAASRTRMMTPEQILAGLDDRFRLLTGTQRGVLPRHRTLEASVDWSYDLLGHSERTMLERLSVFRGGFTLDAAEHVGSGSGLERVEALELLSSLVDRSLVQVDEGGAEARYHLLETVRQYAADRLAASGAEADTRTRHLDAYVALAERMESRFVGASLTDTLDLLDLEHANLRAAMDHAQRSGQAEKALRIVAGIWRYWRIRGNVAEGRRRVETAIEADDTDAHVRARALLGACQLAIIDYTPAWARAFAEEALLLARRIGDERMIARAAVALGRALGFREPDAARPLLEEAIELCTRTGDQEPLGQALFGRYQTRWGVGDLRGARRCLDDVVAHYRALSDPHRLGSCLGVLGQTVTFHGDLEAAGRAHAESAEVMRTFGDRLFEDWALAGLAWILALRGECERAVASLEEVVSRTRTADSPFIANYLIYLAQAELALGRLDLADLHADEAIASLLETNPYLSKVPARIRCDTLRLRGDLEEASRVLDDEMDGSTPRTGVWWGYALEGQGRLLRVRGDTQDSEDVHHEALRLLIDGGGLLFVPDTLESLAGLAAMAESDEEASRLFAAAEVQRERMGTVRFAVEQDGYEADVALARERLSDEDFERAWAEGRAMSLEEAVAYASRGRGERKRPSAGWASLTPTELDVVKLVAEGLTNPQIAERMFVARATVKAHLSNVFRKLGVSSRAELATEVTRRGL